MANFPQNLWVGNAQWMKADKWAWDNADRLGLHAVEGWANEIYVTVEPEWSPADFGLTFTPGNIDDPPNWFLNTIRFSTPVGEKEAGAVWNSERHGDRPPRNLEALMATGELKRAILARLDLDDATARTELKMAADANPGYYEAYTAIYRRLLGGPKHHEIHRDISSWEEMIQKDDRQINRLKYGC